MFDEAIEIASPDDRRAYLDRVCADAPELRQKVEALLVAYQQAGSFLESPAAALGETVTQAPTAEQPGTVIGPYKLIEQIGEGGMGTVWMAQQSVPVKRVVALKLIKPGIDSAQVIARFEAEGQALALMDHPNIAKVLDAGAFGEGGRVSGPSTPGAEATGLARPYFVMELVKGTPITTYCDEKHLTVRERLELFGDVCRAVQHAHQKGIIHRDLKPSNILIAPFDGKPVVKVIDFGVAKATGQRLTDATLVTGFGAVVGTPEYMSPEQAEINNQDIDTRSDIYSLGVLLYELLTGSTPLTKKRVKEAALLEVLRVIREEEPPKPSTRLSTTEELPAIADNRGLDPKKLSGLVRGELDWIVMKALEKDRNRRYETANGLASDIKRYLHDEPVQACPPSTGYRLRKSVRKHRTALTMVSVVIAALALLVIGIVAMVIWRSQERQDLAKEQLKSAESRAGEIQQALDRLSEANNLIQESHWQADHGLDWAKAHEALTRAVELRPDHSLVWFERAAFYIRLGLWDLAAADYARAVQHQKAITIQHEFFHALLLAYGGQMEAYRHVAVQLPERFPEFLTGVPGGTELARICVLAPVPGANLAWAAEQAESVPWQFRGPWHHNAIALVHYRVGEFERALASAQEARRLDSSWRHRITSDAVLAMAHHRLGHTAQARKALAEAETHIHEWQRFRLERDLGQRWDNWWDVLEGLVLFREAKILIDGSAPLPDSREAILRARALIAIGMEQAATLNAEAWSHVGESYGRSGKPTAAIRAFSRAISLQQDNPRPRLARAQTYIALERWDEAIGDLAAVVELQPNSADAKNRLAWLLATCPDEKLRNPRRAVELAREAVALSASDGNIHNTLGVACYRAGDWNAAVEALQKSANLKRDNVLDEVFLAMAYWRLDRKDEAIKYYRRAIAEKKSDFSLSIQERHDVTRFRAEAKELLMVSD